MTRPRTATISTSTITPRQPKQYFTRQRFAYAGFIASIIMVGIGVGIYHPGAGLAAAGLMLAYFSWLLGNEQ